MPHPQVRRTWNRSFKKQKKCWGCIRKRPSCLSMRFTVSTRDSRITCFRLWRTAPSRWSGRLRKTRILRSMGRCCPDPASLSFMRWIRRISKRSCAGRCMTRKRGWAPSMRRLTRTPWISWRIFPEGMPETRSMRLNWGFWPRTAARTAWSTLPWRWLRNASRSVWCTTTRPETTTMTRFRHLSRACGDRTRMRRCIIWQKCCTQGRISSSLRAGSWSARPRMWEMRIPRRWRWR